MLGFIEKILFTFSNRWYVLVFFIFYLFIGITSIGFKKLLIYTFLGYFIALFYEASSIRNGFPFGLYHYIPEVIEKELSVLGVPFWDSLSFVFLSFIPYQISIFIFSKIQKYNKHDIKIIENLKINHSLKVIITSVILMVTLDFIIDPLTLQGKRWFLGNLYYYPGGGSHFGVPFSNYIGWAVTGFTVTGLYVLVDKYFLSKSNKFNSRIINMPFKNLYSIVMYFGIIIFNITITFAAGLYDIGISSLTISIPLSTLLISIIIIKIENRIKTDKLI